MPERPRDGSRTVVRALTTCAFALILGACLDGDAEPIVRSAAVADAAPAPDSGVPGPDGACDLATAPLALFYRAGQALPDGDGIDFLFKIANHTGGPVALSELAIRYYFTNELTVDGQTVVFYTDTCCSAPRSAFNADVTVALQPIAAAPGADHYLEITFDANAGSVAAGDAVQGEAAFHAPNYAQNVSQSNDYSFLAPDVGTQAEWDACPSQCGRFGSCVMTVYRSGALVWGKPP